MTAEVLLDTNAVSELGKRTSPALNRRASEYVATRGRLATSTITVIEATRGFSQVNQPLRVSLFLNWLQAWEVLPFDQDAAEIAGRIDAELRINGTSIELADIFIAAIAIARRRTLVTRNTKHFLPIQALGFVLPLEDWMQPL